MTKIINMNLLHSKTIFEMERDCNNIDNYFLNSLTGEMKNNISCYSIQFMEDLSLYNSGKFNSIKESFKRIILEKSINQYYFIDKMIKDYNNISNNYNFSKNLLDLKVKELKKLLKQNKITKDKYYEYIMKNKFELDNLKKYYYQNKNILKNINIMKKNIESKTKQTFSIDLTNILNSCYFLTISRLKEQFKISNKDDILDINENIDFLNNCSNYILFFDGFEFLNFNQLIDILCSKDLLINENYKNNLFISFYLCYFKSIFINNENFINNYKLFLNNFKDKFINYYSEELFIELNNRFSKWTEFLDFYNEKLNQFNSETTWGLLLFLSKEFIFELNRLIYLIYKMNIDPLNIEKIKKNIN